MKTEDFDFTLPPALIAERPLERRDASRLLVLRKNGRRHHGRFSDLPGYLRRGDMLLLNDTRVLPVRLTGRKPDGRELDILLVRNLSRSGSGARWEILSRGRYSGPLEISDGLQAEVRGGRQAELFFEGDLRDALWKHGEMPLPPYIKRKASPLDKKRYQTVYAKVDGSIAAPTAGLHFTKRLLSELGRKGVLVRRLTLHVGRGTFAPVRAEDIKNHRMEEESFEINARLIEEIQLLRGRLVCVGTTTTRAVEGFLSGRYRACDGGNGTLKGSTDIFIHPGYSFRAVRGLLTNFHLPRSTPLMLASALAGRENLLDAYQEAVLSAYRFFSYGDAMLIV